jgi:phosphopantothenoylcysteine decarboxylase/phosphopantothenate--cysteine ligase
VNLLQDKQILLGISGGIAAYKAAALSSRLTQAGALLDVIMTEAAQQFITPLTFQALTHRPAYTDMFAIPPGENIPHVELARKADLLIIAPATANTLAKLAAGLADNLLTAAALATSAPLLLAPAMESGMWNHQATQANIATLVERGAEIVGPATGHLASGRSGAGRMAEPDEIVEMAQVILARGGVLAGRRILVTAGGTREPLDPVRLITNRSSGKMGYALALSARNRGAQVTLIATPTPWPEPLGVEVVRVETALQMRQAVLAALPGSDALVMAAAVADYRPQTTAQQKIKKDEDKLTLQLVRNPDILAEVAREREATGYPRVAVGFAAETANLLENARAKLEKKRLDLIVANDVSAADSGFAVDTNRVTLLSADGGVEALPLLSKAEVADRVMDKVAGLL